MVAKPNCRRLLKQLIRLAFDFARPKAGNNIAAKMAIIAITTNNSINVKASRLVLRPADLDLATGRNIAGNGRAFMIAVGAFEL